jgi:hypothetical protein
MVEDNTKRQCCRAEYVTLWGWGAMLQLELLPSSLLHSSTIGMPRTYPQPQAFAHDICGPWCAAPNLLLFSVHW